MMDLLALFRRLQEHTWSPRRLLILKLLMDHSQRIDSVEYGRVTFNLGPETVTPEVNAVLPKERVEDGQDAKKGR